VYGSIGLKIESLRCGGELKKALPFLLDMVWGLYRVSGERGSARQNAAA
jgi:hypothetical protein